MKTKFCAGDVSGAEIAATRTATKLSVLRGHMDAGRWRDALKLAASFPRLGAEAAVIRRAWEAYARPEFYRQLGHDIDALQAAGRAALEAKYR